MSTTHLRTATAQRVDDQGPGFAKTTVWHIVSQYTHVCIIWYFDMIYILFYLTWCMQYDVIIWYYVICIYIILYCYISCVLFIDFHSLFYKRKYVNHIMNYMWCYCHDMLLHTCHVLCVYWRILFNIILSWRDMLWCVCPVHDWWYSVDSKNSSPFLLMNKRCLIDHGYIHTWTYDQCHLKL